MLSKREEGVRRLGLGRVLAHWHYWMSARIIKVLKPCPELGATRCPDPLSQLLIIYPWFVIEDQKNFKEQGRMRALVARAKTYVDVGIVSRWLVGSADQLRSGWKEILKVYGTASNCHCPPGLYSLWRRTDWRLWCIWDCDVAMISSFLTVSRLLAVSRCSTVSRCATVLRYSTRCWQRSRQCSFRGM